ncbi:hypothetical protein CEUSTIGMA_g3455.t1 [Chlamydomonas eustigma]|uniref:Glycosyl transferase family 1 domain-containing protein n=1 Tax=Chlamydomonas eustigma TaxID=1157962 RepID=A0A250WZH1_9CHLO|nr:hypothetical protein CEUSTIGMA_g3455.t1 [Chlamydomonas eustigma]|eukprot:GAX76012.1 hypothetical protein CEUSTIGMA_g3455.t1 [Chlamydomonas eustigma]
MANTRKSSYSGRNICGLKLQIILLISAVFIISLNFFYFRGLFEDLEERGLSTDLLSRRVRRIDLERIEVDSSINSYDIQQGLNDLEPQKVQEILQSRRQMDSLLPPQVKSLLKIDEKASDLSPSLLPPAMGSQIALHQPWISSAELKPDSHALIQQLSATPRSPPLSTQMPSVNNSFSAALLNSTEMSFTASASAGWNQTDWPLWWFAPFFDHTSFGKEAATTILGITRSRALPEDSLWVAATEQAPVQSGLCGSEKYDESMPKSDFEALERAKGRSNENISAIVVCHSLPPFWARPKYKWGSCAPCPPVGYTAAKAIGRAMAETDIYHTDFVTTCNKMDEIWVPSAFSKKVLNDSGVTTPIRIVPIAVNTTLYNPALAKPLRLPLGKLVFGRPRRFQLLSTVKPAKPNSDRLMSLFEKASAWKGETSSFWKSLHHTMVQQTGNIDAVGDGDSDAVPSPPLPLTTSPHVKKTCKDEHDAVHMEWITVARTCVSVRVWGVVSGAEKSSDSMQMKGQRATLPARKLSRLRGSAAAVVKTFSHPLAGMVEIKSEETDIHDSVTKRQRPSDKAGTLRRIRPFVFISTFKWEMRKGWDVLLSAYLEEFSDHDSVELYILTKAFMTGSSYESDMMSHAEKRLGMRTEKERAGAPALYVISDHLSAEDYAGLYRSADCYVIPTRGEGWGMPITEAMSMGLPVIVTGWSGTADFVDDRVGYLLKYNLSQVPSTEPWWFQGAKWADADIAHLRQLMRHVYEHPEEAAEKGRAARKLMVSEYSPATVANKVVRELDRIKASIRTRNCSRCFTQYPPEPSFAFVAEDSDENWYNGSFMGSWESNNLLDTDLALKYESVKEEQLSTYCNAFKNHLIGIDSLQRLLNGWSVLEKNRTNATAYIQACIGEEAMAEARKDFLKVLVDDSDDSEGLKDTGHTAADYDMGHEEQEDQEQVFRAGFALGSHVKDEMHDTDSGGDSKEVPGDQAEYSNEEGGADYYQVKDAIDEEVVGDGEKVYLNREHGSPADDMDVVDSLTKHIKVPAELSAVDTVHGHTWSFDDNDDDASEAALVAVSATKRVGDDSSSHVESQLQEDSDDDETDNQEMEGSGHGEVDGGAVDQAGMPGVEAKEGDEVDAILEDVVQQVVVTRQNFVLTQLMN